ncbi:glycosyltransferase family 4 protein [Leptolyngbya ohadii]|uniref:glycosyltransferase family 4 protein n=1 Tax=Leptolyngbya ohadii TaxID=1962290 RepID=UPI000B5A09AB|nr:glycosyltransferase family 1 protein [Leptolyngbya ohadii]
MSGVGEPHENSAQVVASLPFVGRKPTGLATYAINLTAELTLPGLTLLAPSALKQHTQPKQPCYEIPGGMSAEEGKAGHFRRLKWTQFQLPGIYRQLQSDLLFSLVPEAPIGTISRTKCQSIVMVHDLIPLRFPNWRSPLFHYARLYVPQVLKQADHILCNSQATAQDVCDFYGVPAHKITPVLLSHDSRHFCVPDASPEPISERPYFFYVGRHDPYKNLIRLIRAFSALPHRQEYDLLIAGSPDPRYTPLLKQQAIDKGVSEQVKFLDYVEYDQLPVLLNRSIALVYPSLWEGFGFPVLEAMACGAPVITSNLSSLPEVAGDAAILIDPYDEQALADAMAQVATDDQTRQDLRSAGLKRASEFSWAKTGQQTAEVLQRFI